jgi:TRAP transporter TAXI family solute receptor
LRPDLIRLTTGAAVGSPANRALGEALVHDYELSASNTRFELIQGAQGAVDTLVDVQAGSTDCGMSLADVSYLAFAGRLGSRSERFDRLRGVAVLDMAPVHLLVRAGAGIRQVTDLRGRHVAIGPDGSETQLIARQLIEAFGLAHAITAHVLPFQTAAERLRSGELHAMFFTVSAPATLVENVIGTGVRLLPLNGGPIPPLLEQYRFLQLTQIPGGLYTDHAEPTRTVGVDKVVLCRDDLPDSLVYDFTRRLFNVLPQIASSLGRGRFSALEHAPASSVPLHPGAARYYRERELFP